MINKTRDSFFSIFTTFFILFLILFLGTIAYSAFMTYRCYTSNDPNSMACFMISERTEFGIRNR